MKKVTLLSVIVSLICACGSSSEVGSGFDRKTMLAMYADEFIIPAFTEFNQKATELNTAIRRLSFQPNESNLKNAKAAWVSCYGSWQLAGGFNFGPATDQFGTLEQNIGLYPVNAEKIENFISASDTSLQNFDRDSRGLLAVEYLLYSKDESATIESLSGSRAAYLRSITADVANRVSKVAQGWNNYRETFVSSAGTDGGSSASLLYNNFVGNYEAIKNFKVGLPLGKRPGQQKSEPERVEAYFSGYSTEMMRKNFASIVALWQGKKNTGWKTYLENVTGGAELINATLLQINATQTAMDALPSDVAFAELCRKGDQRAENLHTELQKLTRYFKSDMSSLLGIAITYQSGDGD